MTQSLPPYDDDGNFYDDNVIIKSIMEPITQSIAAISLLCSFAIILTAIVFPIMLRNKPFMQMFFIIAVTDFISSIVVLFGYAHGTKCIVQGALFIFTQRAVYFWITALTYQLYDVAMNGRLRLTMTFLHTLIWSLSIFLELIVFVNDMYGVDDPQGLQICLLQAKYKNKAGTSFKYWMFVVLVIPLIVCIVLISVLLWKLSTRYVSSVPIKILIQTFYRYPLVLIVLWFPFFICLIIFVSSTDGIPQHLYAAYDAALAVIPTFGIYQCITFFVKSTEARWRWFNLFLTTFYPDKELFPLELNNSMASSNSSRPDDQDQDVHKLSISRGFSFGDMHDEEGSENLSSITKSSFLLSSLRTGDSMGEALSSSSSDVKNPIDSNNRIP